MVLVKKKLKKKEILCSYIAAGSVCRGETVSAEPRALWVVSLLTPAVRLRLRVLFPLPRSSLKCPFQCQLSISVFLFSMPACVIERCFLPRDWFLKNFAEI